MHVGRAISNLHICGTSTFMVIAYSLKHPNDVKTPYFLNYTIRVSFKMKEMGGGDIMINALGVHSVLVISIHSTCCFVLIYIRWYLYTCNYWHTRFQSSLVT